MGRQEAWLHKGLAGLSDQSWQTGRDSHLTLPTTCTLSLCHLSRAFLLFWALPLSPSLQVLQEPHSSPSFAALKLWPSSASGAGLARVSPTTPLGFSSLSLSFCLSACLVPNPGHPPSQRRDPLPRFSPPLTLTRAPLAGPAPAPVPEPPTGAQHGPPVGAGWAAAATAARRARTEREAARGGSGGSCRGPPGGARGEEGQARAPERTRVHTPHVCSRSHPPVRLGPADTRAHSPENLACTSARGARCSPAPPGRPRPPPRRAALAPPAAPPLAFAGSQGSRARPPGLVAIATLVSLTPPSQKAPEGKGKGSCPTPPWVSVGVA